MSATARKQYDHRIRQAIVKTGNPGLFPKVDIPDSTWRSWLRRGVADVVTLDARDAEIIELHTKVAKLEKRTAILAAVVRLLVTLVEPRIDNRGWRGHASRWGRRRSAMDSRA